MGNIKSYNFNFLKLKLTNSDYWDYTLSNDNRYHAPLNSIVQDGLLVDIDFNNNMTFASETSATTITSALVWDDAINNGVTLKDIGFTGVDNGLVTYNTPSGDTGNTSMLNAMLTSTLNIPSEQYNFFMTRVSGNTQDYVYPMSLSSDTGSAYNGDYMSFSGGFYQGYYALDEYEYQVLPNRVNKGFVYDFWVRPNSETPSISGGTILNDMYPENKGMFFYLGTRAENKFWNVFDGLSTGCTGTSVSEYCTTLKETDINTSDNYPLSPPPLEFTKLTNKFQFYHRGSGRGCGTTCVDTASEGFEFKYTGGTDAIDYHKSMYDLTQRNMYVEYTQYLPNDSRYNEFTFGVRAGCPDAPSAITMTSVTTYQTDFRNPFTVFSRSNGHLCGESGATGVVGATACSYSGSNQPIMELDWEADLIGNAFGLQIKDDGSIGYKYIDKECLENPPEDSPSTGLTVMSDFSLSGMVAFDTWNHIAIRFVADKTYDDCELQIKPQRTGKLMIYVNGLLKLVKHGFKEIILKSLNEDKTKQQGVPYNMSLGGGTQGLIDSVTFDGKDPFDSGLVIEENFAGTFIGDIAKFRYYNQDLGWCGIKNNYNNEKSLFGHR